MKLTGRSLVSDEIRTILAGVEKDVVSIEVETVWRCLLLSNVNGELSES